jgi:hypothetical protein
MPAMRSGKPKPRGGFPWVGTIVAIVVVLAVAAAGLYYWSRASVASTAKRYVERGLAVFTEGRFDTAALKQLVVKDEARAIEELEKAGKALPGPYPGPKVASISVTCTVTKVSVGLSEARATVKIEAAGDYASALPQSITVVLLREGLAWKVSGKRTTQAAVQSMRQQPG